MAPPDGDAGRPSGRRAEEGAVQVREIRRDACRHDTPPSEVGRDSNVRISRQTSESRFCSAYPYAVGASVLLCNSIVSDLIEVLCSALVEQAPLSDHG